MISAENLVRWQSAAPFWISLGLAPLAWIGAFYGGWTLILLPVVTWYLFALADAALGLNLENADPDTDPDDLFWYRLVTLIWAPVQFVTIFGLIWYATHGGHLSAGGKIALFFGVGVLSGTVGINYSHELMHQKSRPERYLADLLLAMVLYSHFRSEHLLVGVVAEL